jgi:hypothetical protein
VDEKKKILVKVLQEHLLGESVEQRKLSISWTLNLRINLQNFDKQKYTPANHDVHSCVFTTRFFLT